jgi:hypothetical protein
LAGSQALPPAVLVKEHVPNLKIGPLSSVFQRPAKVPKIMAEKNRLNQNGACGGDFEVFYFNS